MRSVSNEHLPSYHNNPPSLSSHNRSLSVEALTPLSVDTSYSGQASGRQRSRWNPSRTPELKIATGTKVSRDKSPRPRSNSNPPRKQRLPVPDSVAHRQRAASVSSSIQRQHKSGDDSRYARFICSTINVVILSCCGKKNSSSRTACCLQKMKYMYKIVCLI